MSVDGRRRRRPAPDDGFTLVEVLVAIIVIGIVMTALTSFFIGASAIMSIQRDEQAAVELATDGVDWARAVGFEKVGHGRDSTDAGRDWDSAPAVVRPYLADSELYPPAGTPATTGKAQDVPTTRTDRLNGLDYSRTWYIGQCWRDPVAGSACAVGSRTGVPMLRVVVSVFWPDRHCAESRCSYVTSLLLTASTKDPLLPMPSASAGGAAGSGAATP